MPTSVRIREVGPRDGFQNEPEVIPTAEKVRLIEMLGRTGLRRLEVTSFVRPDVIPQLSDAEEVLASVRLPREVAVSVLIPNERGLERALAHRDRFSEINGFLSASETHNQKNVGRPIAESLAGLERTFARARSEGLRCEGVISTSFGCPYEGHVPTARVLSIASALVEAGASRSVSGTRPGWRTRSRCASSSRRLSPRCRALKSPRTSTTPAARVWPTCSRRSRPGLRASSPRSESWAMPGSGRGDGQHCHRGPRLDVARDGDLDRHRVGLSLEASRAVQRVLGGHWAVTC